jgi:hypothetical protein
MREPRFIQLHEVNAEPLAAEAAAGLLAPTAHVSPKFFYDALGSRLFDAITELDEYYPTRTEAAIMAACQAEIVAALQPAVGPAPTLVDLGAGNGAKAARWFRPLGLALPAFSASTPRSRWSAWAWIFQRIWPCRRAWSKARPWSSIPAPASATSAASRRCGCCVRPMPCARAGHC